MKKELLIHLFSFGLVFLLITLAKSPWFDKELTLFWLGGVLGTLLLDTDHLTYAFFWRPHELTPQRTMRLINQKRYWSAILLLAGSRQERTQLLAHTVSFQALFAILSFLAVTSSTSILGKGLVLGFFLHSLVDQALDFQEIGDLRNWFWQVPKAESRTLHWLWFLGGILFFVFLALLF